MTMPHQRAEQIAQRILAIMTKRNQVEADNKLAEALYNKALQDYAVVTMDPAATATAQEVAREEIHVALDRVLDNAGILPKLISELTELAAAAQRLRDEAEGD